MAWYRLPLLWLRSLLAFAGAVAAIWAGNVAGGELAAALDLPRGGTGRLAWDLAWLTLAGITAFALLTRLAPRWPRAHAWLLLALMVAAMAWATQGMAGEFPAWFTLGAWLSLALQYAVGAEALGPRARRPS
ncbi:hypothetical protein [Arenimonas sp. MALMAid1274]|uniref:hypothetical protein n=1 Tax=Arenimonas sp. MALMAid1274 TaxID=3411630 RepID=UPI003BA27C54